MSDSVSESESESESESDSESDSDSVSVSVSVSDSDSDSDSDSVSVSVSVSVSDSVSVSVSVSFASALIAVDVGGSSVRVPQGALRARTASRRAALPALRAGFVAALLVLDPARARRAAGRRERTSARLARARDGHVGDRDD
ncbi:MAG: hypothetical protein AB7S26_07825 [Sandaracinaceae bacterium]